MTVSFAGCAYDCTKAVRNGDKAVLFLTDGGSVEFRGINDWEAFTLTDEDWSLPEVTPEEQLRADVDFIAIMTGVIL